VRKHAYGCVFHTTYIYRGLGATAAVTTLPLDHMRGIRFGYTAMTWGNEERQAIDDIAAVGFPGIQFRANAVTDFKPAELKDL
jgi:inosose dehydratase